MKKSLLLSLFLLGIAPVFVQAQVKNDLDAAVGRFQQFYNHKQYDSIFNMLSTRIQQLLPLDKIGAAMGSLHGQAGDMETFDFVKQTDKLVYYKANFKNTPLTLIVSKNADNKLDAFRFVPYQEETTMPVEKSNIILTTATGKLFGSLTLPQGAQKVAVVLLIAGSGPTDRNCNSNLGLKTNAFKMIADSLKAAGIACVRYDKRGVGESAGALNSPSELKFDTYVADAVGFIKLLKNDARFSQVIVAGHSEGSLIGMIAAQKGNVKKYISIAGAGERIDKTLKDQYAVQSKDLADTAVKIMDSLRMGKDVQYVPDALFTLFNASMQPYMRSWLKYDPQVEIKKLLIPVLIMQGDNDMQVSMKNADNLKKAFPKAKLVVINKMNHALKDAPTDRAQNFATYDKADLPLSPGFTTAMIRFIKG